MAHTQLEIIEKYLGKLPECVTLAIESKSEYDTIESCYAKNLENGLTKISKTKLGRYYSMSRVVFSLLAAAYKINLEIKVKEKIKFGMGKQSQLDKEIEKLIDSSTNTISNSSPNKLKLRKSRHSDKVLTIYKDCFSRIKSMFPQLNKIEAGTNFKNKMMKEKHPLFSKDIICAMESAVGSKFDVISPIIITIESIIHGIDDYVDEGHQNKEQALLDMTDVVIGTITSIVYVLSIQKSDYWNNIRSLITKKNKAILLLDFLKDSLIELSNVPFVENRTQRDILLATNIDSELEIARKNLEIRSEGTTKALFSPTYVFLNKDSDIEEIERTISILRLQQMLAKDFKDISFDLKNKDFKGISGLFSKYEHEITEFKIRCELLNSYYLAKAVEILYKPNKYTKAKEYIGEKIVNNYTEIKEIISKF